MQTCSNSRKIEFVSVVFPQAAGNGLFQFFPQQRVELLRIGLTACALHHLADEEVQQLFVATAIS